MKTKLTVFITILTLLLSLPAFVQAFDPLDIPQKPKKITRHLKVITRKKVIKSVKKLPKPRQIKPPVQPKPEKKFELVKPQYREDDLEILGYLSNTVIVKNRRTNMIFLVKDGEKYNNCEISKKGVECYEKIRIF
jgi:hypothetical protein